MSIRNANAGSGVTLAAMRGPSLWFDEADPGLPIKLGPASNGEYDPQPLSPVLTAAIREGFPAGHGVGVLRHFVSTW